MSHMPRTSEVAELVRRLSLTPHPEGGWSPGGWSLVGCVVAPGFEFRRFVMADRIDLLANHPLEAESILRLTT
jgi:predicted cupin superfamily sugar epimerase